MSHNTPANRQLMCEVPTPEGPLMIPYAFERSRRSRYMRLIVNDLNEVILRVPWRTSEKSATDFLKTQGDWLFQTLGKVQPRFRLVEYLQKYPYISAQGRRWQLKSAYAAGAPCWKWDEDSASLQLYCDNDPSFRDHLLLALKRIGREVVRERALALGESVAAPPFKVTIRNQRTRWGSCSEGSTVSFNWRLILLPPEIMDHIIYHELAHLTHLNHSQDFWDLLQHYDKQAFANDHKLSKLSSRIMALGR